MTPTRDNKRHQNNVRLKTDWVAFKAQLDEAEAAGLDRLARRLQRKLSRIGDEFVQENWGLVIREAKGFFPYGDASHQDSEEYVEAAALGMWEAFLIWDPAKGSFGTFSKLYIQGQTKRAVRAAESPEISYGDFSARPRVRAAIARLEDQGLDTTDIALIAAESGESPELVSRVLAARPTSLDVTVGDDENQTLSDIVAAPQTDVDLNIDVSDLIAASGLSPAELWVYVRNSGIDGAPPRPLAAVGKQIGIGRQTVQRLNTSARSKVSGTASSTVNDYADA